MVVRLTVAFLRGGLLAGHTTLGGGAALDALQISPNSVRGRVFRIKFGLVTAQSWLATGESIVGTLIEGIFVAMLTQRFSGH